MLAIAGIGSRHTPTPILEQMTTVGAWCKLKGVFVYSGHADGADYAFERGATNHCVVFLPWWSFNGHQPILGIRQTVETDPKLDALVERHHPHPFRLTPEGRCLHRRNGAQVVGYRQYPPVQGVVCWTADGGPSGGTGQAIRVARALNVPVINMYYPTLDKAHKVIPLLCSLLGVRQ